MRRRIVRVLGGDLSRATSSSTVDIFLGNCWSISEDSVFAVWELKEMVCRGLILVLEIMNYLNPYLFCVSVSECSDKVSRALMAEE